MDHTLDNVTKSERFWDMDVVGKLKFLCKVVVFLATGGFVFPTIFSPD